MSWMFAPKLAGHAGIFCLQYVQCVYIVCELALEGFQAGLLSSMWLLFESLIARNSRNGLCCVCRSFGVMTWEVMTHGQVPYTGVEAPLMYLELMRGLKLSRPTTCPDAV